MAEIVPFPFHRLSTGFSRDDHAALSELVTRMRRAGAVGYETETVDGAAYAYVVGAEGETLLIIVKSGLGVAVRSGFAGDTLWRGATVARYARSA